MDIENLKKNFEAHWDKATAIRMLSIDAVQKAKSGHPGMPMGMADVCTVLFDNHLKFDPKYPNWPDRDRFILSAGHGSMLLYSILYLTGYKMLANIQCSQGGHNLTNQVLRKILANDANYSILEIKSKTLPKALVNNYFLRSIA